MEPEVLLTIDQAFNMNEFNDLVRNAKPVSIQAIAIDAPKKTKVSRFASVKQQDFINVTFVPLGAEGNRYRSSGTKAFVKSFMATTNRAAFIKALELYEITKDLPVIERVSKIEKFIQDDVKIIHPTSKLDYNPVDSEGIKLLDPRTEKPIVTKNHTIVLFADDIPSRELSSKVRSISTWIQGSATNDTFDPLTATTEGAETKTAEELEKELLGEGAAKPAGK